jgi:hypothetical protein
MTIQIDPEVLRRLVDAEKAWHTRNCGVEWYHREIHCVAKELRAILRDYEAGQEQSKRDFMGTAHPDHPAQQMQREKRVVVHGDGSMYEYTLTPPDAKGEGAK